MGKCEFNFLARRGGDLPYAVDVVGVVVREVGAMDG